MTSTETQMWCSTLLIALVVVLGACGDDDGSADAGFDAAGDTSLPSDTGVDASIDAPDATIEDPFDTAVSIDIGAAPLSDAIEIPGETDYYRFEGTAGQWVFIGAGGNIDGDPAMIDTVITLFDSTRTQIAENNDAVPRANPDAELITRLPSTGTYYLQVQDFAAWSGGEPRGGLVYLVSVRELAALGTALSIDAEPGDDETTAATFTWTGPPFGHFIVGTYRDDADVDVVGFSITAGPQVMSTHIMPQGQDGYGSTTTTGRMWITTAAEPAVIIGRVTGGDGRVLTPPLSDGDYLLWVDHPGIAGSNDFYVIKATLGPENDSETEVASGHTNDVFGAADTVSFIFDGAMRAFIFSALPDTDVDYFQFDVAADQEVTIFCGSRVAGSGVIGLVASLHDSTDTLRSGATSTETTTEAARFVETRPPAGTYYLRVEKARQDVAIVGDWARCSISIVPL